MAAAELTPPPGGPAGAGRRPGRRELVTALGLAAAGGAAALLAAGRIWVRLAAARQAPLPDVTAALPGRDLESLVGALGVVGLAGAVALLATRRWGRLVVGLVLAAAGLTIAARALPHLAAPAPDRARVLLIDSGVAAVAAGTPVAAATERAWPAVAATGGLLLLAAGGLVVVRGRRWPGLSARYEVPGAAAGRPRAAPTPTEQGWWDAVDRGDDPTRDAG